MVYGQTKSEFILENNYITVKELKKEIRKKITGYISQTYKTIALFLLFLFITRLFRYLPSPERIWVGLIYWTFVIFLLYRIEGTNNKKINELYRSKDSYHNIFSFQITKSDTKRNVLNSDDLIWAAGVLTLNDRGLSSENERNKVRQKIKGKLTLEGYKPKEMRYVYENEFYYWSDKSAIPVLITLSGIIYPLFEVDYYFNEYLYNTMAIGKFWREAYGIMSTINDRYNLPNKLDSEGRIENYDLITDIGYIILAPRSTRIQRNRRTSHKKPLSKKNDVEMD